MATEILAFCRIEVQREQQCIVNIPMRLGEQSDASLEVHQRRLIRGRGFGSLTGSQIELSQGQAFRVVGDEGAGEVQVSDDIEYLLWGAGAAPLLIQQTTDLQVHRWLVLVSNLRIG